MKLMLITSTYPTPTKPHQGVFNENLVRTLSEHHQVRVIAPVPWTEQVNTQSQCKNGEVVFPTFYYPPGFLRSSYGYFYWQSIRSRFRKMCDESQPEVVLGYWAHPDSYAAVRGAKSLGVPSVVMVGGSDIRILAKGGIRRRLIRSVLMQATQVIAFSRDLKEHVIALGIDPNKIEVLYRGVDSSLFSPGDQRTARQKLQLDPADLIMLWVGRLVEVKNPQKAIRALASCKDRFGDRLKLAIVGSGSLRPEIDNLIVQLGVEKNCLILGSLDHHQLVDWYRAADLMLLTSRSEGVPNVLLESQACGLRFVATDVGGVCEIADSNFDTLVPADDEQAYARALANRLEGLSDRTTKSWAPRGDDSQAFGRKLTAILERVR